MEFWKLNLKEVGILKIIWELEFWKLSLRIRILEIKFEINWKFENDLRIRVLKIKLWIGVLDIIWRLKKICEGACLEENDSKFIIKNGIFYDPDP